MMRLCGRGIIGAGTGAVVGCVIGKHQGSTALLIVGHKDSMRTDS